MLQDMIDIILDALLVSVVGALCAAAVLTPVVISGVL